MAMRWHGHQRTSLRHQLFTTGARRRPHAEGDGTRVKGVDRVDQLAIRRVNGTNRHVPLAEVFHCAKAEFTQAALPQRLLFVPGRVGSEAAASPAARAAA